MELRILGSGAADGIPGFFADDRVSRYAINHRGKDLRTRASALLDGTLKIDFGPDSYAQVNAQGLNPLDWSAIVFTHSHEDHLCVAELQYMLFPFTSAQEAPLAIYGNETVIQLIRNRYPDWPLELHETHSFESFSVNEYQVTPIAANHEPDEDCQNLIFSRDGVSLLYATDTGVWTNRTWDFLVNHRLHGLVIECTDGLNPSGYSGHLAIDSCVEVVLRLRSEGILGADAPVLTTHHSHEGNATHVELEKALTPHGIRPSFDGLTVQI